MFITKPEGFVPVPTSAFEDYLKWCNDYVRTAYVGAGSYKFRATGKEFAVVLEERGEEHVYVDPNILSK